jgi:hypothetical protein
MLAFGDIDCDIRVSPFDYFLTTLNGPERCRPGCIGGTPPASSNDWSPVHGGAPLSVVQENPVDSGIGHTIRAKDSVDGYRGVPEGYKAQLRVTVDNKK